MKRNSKKLLTLLLAGTLCAATIGGATTLIPAEAATAKTYLLTSIFKAGSDAKIGAEVIGSETAQTTKFTFVKSTSEAPKYEVEFDNDLALKWFEGKNNAKYLNFTFAFADMNFTEATFTVQSAPYQAVEGDKAINTIKFVKTSETQVDVKVYAGEEEPADVASYALTLSDTKEVKVELGAGAEAGEFVVNANETPVGSFTNVGATYADNGKVDTFVISATPAETATETAIYLKSLNGQSFNNVTGESTKSVTDDAAPVLIVNQEVSNFLIGTAFNLDYIGVDVLKSSVTIASNDRKYYQYNPADTEIKGTNISTSTYFMDTVYYTNEAGEVSKEAKDGFTATSVWQENGEEYVSIWFDLGDDTFTGSVGSEAEDNEKVRYELAWYANDVKGFTVGEGESADTRDYIVLNRNEEGPTYTGIVLDEANAKNVYTKADGTTTEDYEESTLKIAADKFEQEIQEKAKDVYAGSNAKLQISSVDWLIDDNNGHRSLSFTISYRTPTSSSESTASNKKYNTLEIPTTKEGPYEFKIFATDAAGNAMKYYLDGELVSVTSSNVWQIEEIPTFSFEVENKGIKTAEGEDSDTLDNKILDESYTMSEVKIVGASEQQSAYKLYKLKDEIYNSSNDVAKKLSSIKFADLNKKADELVVAKLTADATLKITDIDYMEIYMEAYLALAAAKLDSGLDLTNAFVEIEVFNSDITEEDKEAWEASDNKYNWSETSRRFTAAEEGLYLIMADYWDAELAVVDRVPAYQLIEVAEEEDTIKGVSEWLENNLVSVILFSIAGVLAIAIVVLLLVKPSDETLEDVDKKVKKD